MSDVITLVGVEGIGYHGVLPEEREQGQPFVVDLEVRVDAALAAVNDDLSLTVDYSTLARDALSVIEGDPCQLIETVAERIAGRILRHEPVGSVKVTVHKPAAPIGVPFTDVSVSVVRTR
jgi:dihydroneopterin aldolase